TGSAHQGADGLGAIPEATLTERDGLLVAVLDVEVLTELLGVHASGSRIATQEPAGGLVAVTAASAADFVANGTMPGVPMMVPLEVWIIWNVRVSASAMVLLASAADSAASSARRITSSYAVSRNRVLMPSPSTYARGTLAKNCCSIPSLPACTSVTSTPATSTVSGSVASIDSYTRNVAERTTCPVAGSMTGPGPKP